MANFNKATVTKFDGNNWVNIGNAGFSADWINFISLAFSPSGEPYVAFEDWTTNPSGKATVMKFDGNNWLIVGTEGFSAGQADYINIAFSPSGEPFVAYVDYVNSNKATAMEFDGTNWVNVGNAGFSAGLVLDLSLAFSPVDGHPYLAYYDGGNTGKATVMTFNGTNWVDVGNAGFSASNTIYESLAFSASGQPYVVYSDYAYAYKATLMKFDGTNWINVGNAGFSAGEADYTSLAFSPTGEPYVAYMDYATIPFGKTTLMKFDGTNWVNVGNAGFSEGTAGWTSLAFSPTGEPYIAFQDNADSNRATVMKYDSVMVGITKQQESTISIYPNPATDKITIETAATPTQCQLSIINLNGQALITRQITEPKTQLDISNLPSGVYFVRVTGEKRVEVGKFVKQ